MYIRRYIFLLLALGFLLFLMSRVQPLNQNTQREKIAITSAPHKQSSQASALQNDVEKVADDYQHIVVSIVATKDIPVMRRCMIDPGNSEDPFFGFRQCIVKNQKVETSGGTGFAVDSRGVILTNKHVVSDESADYTVLFNDGTEDKVMNIYRDPDTDIALVKINRTINSVARLGDSGTVKPGQFVVAMGNALGEFKNSTSFGIVSGLDRTIVVGDRSGNQAEQLEKVMQTDAAINTGNSGGPLIALNGDVIAVNTAKAQGENIGFAIPINTVKPILQTFVQ